MGFRRLLAVGVAVLGVLSACQTSSTAAARDTLVWAKPAEQSSLNYGTAGEGDWEFMNLVYDSLTSQGTGNDPSPTPDLATSWNSQDPLTWIFHLRSDVRFSNGRLMDSSDVVSSWQGQVKYGFFVTSLCPVSSVTAIDLMTVKFSLSMPCYELPAAMNIFFILPGKEEAAKTFDPNKDMLGTGPYEVVSHVPDVEWKFKANPYYWRTGYPKFKNLDIKIIKDESARRAALQAGTVDITEFTNLDEPGILSGDPHARAIAENTLDFYFVLMNSVSPTTTALLNPLVRRAINLAINREEIIHTALAGYGHIATPAPANLPDGCPVTDLAPPAGDVNTAKSLLSQSGLKNVTLNFSVPTGQGPPNIPEIGQVIQQELDAVGISTNITLDEPGAWGQKVSPTGHFDLTIGYNFAYSDAALATHAYSLSYAPYWAGIMAPTPTTDSLVAKADATQPGPARAAVLSQVCQQIASDAYEVPLAQVTTVVGYRTDRVKVDVQGLEGTENTFRLLPEWSAP